MGRESGEVDLCENKVRGSEYEGPETGHHPSPVTGVTFHPRSMVSEELFCTATVVVTGGTRWWWSPHPHLPCPRQTFVGRRSVTRG